MLLLRRGGGGGHHTVAWLLFETFVVGINMESFVSYTAADHLLTQDSDGSDERYYPCCNEGRYVEEYIFSSSLDLSIHLSLSLPNSPLPLSPSLYFSFSSLSLCHSLHLFCIFFYCFLQFVYLPVFTLYVLFHPLLLSSNLSLNVFVLLFSPLSLYLSPISKCLHGSMKPLSNT